MSLNNQPSFQVSARKYRPQSFDTVVGQDHVITTLQNAVCQQSVAHAYLFSGLRGVGKTTCARIFAKAINCAASVENQGNPCENCDSCKAYQSQRSFNIIELDAASNNSVDNVREWMQESRIPPVKGKYKVYIIDEVHMLSTQAFNAFLKTLEEPPSHAVFILATTEKHKLPPTILSRCQALDFVSVPLQDIITNLHTVAEKEAVKVDDDVLHIIALKADGSLRDALNLFDKLVVFAGNVIQKKDAQFVLHTVEEKQFLELIASAYNNNLSDVLLTVDRVYREGHSPQRMLEEMLACLRNLLVAKDTRTEQLITSYKSVKKLYIKKATDYPVSYLVSALSLVQEGIRYNSVTDNKRYHLDYVFIQLTYLSQAYTLTSGTQGEKKKVVYKPSMAERRLAPNTNLLPSSVSSSVVSSSQIAKDNMVQEKDTLVDKVPLQTTDSAISKKNVPIDATKQGGKNMSLLESIREKSKYKIDNSIQTAITSQNSLDTLIKKFQEKMVKNNSPQATVATQASYKLIADNSVQIMCRNEGEKFFFQNEVIPYLDNFLKIEMNNDNVLFDVQYEESTFVPKNKELQMEELMQCLREESPWLYELVCKLNLKVQSS